MLRLLAQYDENGMRLPSDETDVAMGILFFIVIVVAIVGSTFLNNKKNQ